jgi:hypothetical protein
MVCSSSPTLIHPRAALVQKRVTVLEEDESALIETFTATRDGIVEYLKR